MEKKFSWPTRVLYLDDSKQELGKHYLVIKLQSYRMSMLPYVNPDKQKDELNRR